MEEPMRLDAAAVKRLPYNVRLDLARSSISEAASQAQALCDVDDATLALILDSVAGGIRANLARAASMQCVLASADDGTRLVRANGKAAKVVPADPPEESE